MSSYIILLERAIHPQMTLGTLGSSMAFDNVCLLKYVIKLLCYQRKLFQQFSQLDFSVLSMFYALSNRTFA